MNKITEVTERAARIIHQLLFSPYLTPRRLLNTALVRLHEKLKLDNIHAYPEILLVEATNSCDSTCRLCPVGEGRRSRPASVLDMETFKQFIDELAPYAQKVHFHNWGDPILDKHLVDKIRYAHDRKLITFIATTLYYLTPEHARELVRSGLDELSVSIHAASQETYQAYQPGRSFENVINNIKTLIEAKKAESKTTPTINLTFVRTKKNQHEVELLPDLVKSLGVDSFKVSEVSLNSRFMWSDMAMQDRQIGEEVFLAEVKDRADEWLTEEQLQDFDYSVPSATKLESCDRLWRVGILNSDGTVPPCCDVYRPENNFGQLKKNGRFQDIWNNEAFRTARRSFNKPKEGDALLICTHCPGHSSKNKARNPLRF